MPQSGIRHNQERAEAEGGAQGCSQGPKRGLLGWNTPGRRSERKAQTADYETNPMGLFLRLAVGFATVLDSEDTKDLAIGAEEDPVIAKPEAEFAGVLAL